MNSTLKKLPIGIQNLPEIMERGCVYIDKTPHVFDMVENGKSFFLSRPRRFGKSLLVDTFKQLFEGNEAIFRGLYIHDKWDWSRRHPVIKIDFAGGDLHSAEALDLHIREILQSNQNALGLSCEARSIPGCLRELIQRAYEKYGQKVVVLVDEYDKPILDNIEDVEIASAMRTGLKNLYSVLKEQDALLQFVFITGVSKFSKVSIFSGLNQLEDITLDERYATICGYTQQDLEHSFAGHLAGIKWEKLKRWYNGYRFLGEAVYNPYDILLFIKKGQMYRNYWFETGSPSFLLKLFRQRCYFLPDLEDLEVGEEILDSYELEQIDPITLLFQAGYLTIHSTRTRHGELMFRLTVPNQEVRSSLNRHLLDGYLQTGASQRSRHQEHLYDQLITGNLQEFVDTLKRLFAGVPWRNFSNNDLEQFEGYYASVLYALFMSLNATVIPEQTTNHGQVDLTVELEEDNKKWVYVMEIKVVESAGSLSGEENPALEQIREKGYSEPYRNQPGSQLFELGLIFGKRERNLVRADWREI